MVAFDTIADRAPAGGPGCLMINTALELLPKDGPVAEIARRALKDNERYFRTAVEAGKAAGEIDAPVDEHLTGSALLALFLGLHVLARSPTDPALLRSIADHAAALLSLLTLKPQV